MRTIGFSFPKDASCKIGKIKAATKSSSSTYGGGSGGGSAGSVLRRRQQHRHEAAPSGEAELSKDTCAGRSLSDMTTASLAHPSTELGGSKLKLYSTSSGLASIRLRSARPKETAPFALATNENTYEGGGDWMDDPLAVAGGAKPPTRGRHRMLQLICNDSCAITFVSIVPWPLAAHIDHLANLPKRWPKLARKNTMR
uniref:Uncharacterized protein n=1 Tax=Oryza punctata TaxID=4537 RepID=A0A0E0M5Z3_ORYPU